jgi:uncharacterized membrane protein YphA (DoxX/SURF4 family)
MKLTLYISRLIVGLLFIFSGLIKANDPLGLSYKMQEFFEIWGWHALNDYTLGLSVVIIAFEIIAGMAVLLGWQFKLFSWLLLLLILFFTFLTGYALFSGKIRECGCFGDCIKLTAKDSFVKDIVLLVLITLLFVNREKVKPVLASKWALVILILTTLFSFGFQFYVLRHLPAIDCLPYKKGNSIIEKMKIPAGAIPDSTVINFVYEKDGKQLEFDAEHFPADFNDSTYKFVRRYDKIIRKGNAEPAIKDFILVDSAGNDVTISFLQLPSTKIVFLVRNVPGNIDRYSADIRSIFNQSKNMKADFAIVTSSLEQTRLKFSELLRGESPVYYSCDAVAIKTASRSPVSIYVLRGAEIEQKWSYVDLHEASDFISKTR